MPENVTRFQPPENVKKSLIRWTHIDIMPSRLPTFFHEEPKKKATEEAYKNALKSIPVSNEKPDPWKTMR
jgi:hypothetical protein